MHLLPVIPEQVFWDKVSNLDHLLDTVFCDVYHLQSNCFQSLNRVTCQHNFTNKHSRNSVNSKHDTTLPGPPHGRVYYNANDNQMSYLVLLKWSSAQTGLTVHIQ